MKAAYVLTFHLPKKIVYFIKKLKKSGCNIDSILTISKELLGDINGYYALNINIDNKQKDNRQEPLILPKQTYKIRKS